MDADNSRLHILAASFLILVLLSGCDRMVTSRNTRLVKEADWKAAQGDYLWAINLYEAALDGTPQSAEVHFKLAGNAQSLRLPANTVLFRAPGLQVAIVDAHRRIQLKSIVEGRDFGNTIEVLSGLDADDAVVINPPDSIVNGVTVRVAAPAPAQAPKSMAKAS